MSNILNSQMNHEIAAKNNMDSIQKPVDAETVANIEKWLKLRTDSVSTIGPGGIKSKIPVYLEEETSHTFLEKISLPIYIDSSVKKPNLSYEPFHYELQSEKLLETCTRDDDFSLSGLQYDPLDPLELGPEMMVAGEILPTTSDLSALNIDTKSNDLLLRSQQGKSPLSKENNTNVSKKSARFHVEDISFLESITDRITADEDSKILEKKLKKSLINNKSLQQFKFKDSNNHSETCLTIKVVDQSKHLKVKSRESVQERNELPDRKLVLNEENSISLPRSMTLVSIISDEIPKMTEIVMKNGREEQSRRSKISDLLKADDSLKMDISGNSIRSFDPRMDNRVDQHDLLISNALEKLGYTNDIFRPFPFIEQGRTFFCPKDDCHRHFSRLHALKIHLLTHYGVRPFKCDFEGCSWAFYSEFKLKRHRETHSKKKDYICDVEDCHRRFTTIYNLWSHRKLHQRPNRIFCHVPKCKEKFQTKRALEVHMKSHDQSHAPYICKHEGCGKRYYSSNALTSHQRCHNYKETDIRCFWPGCGKIFDKPCRLKAHTRSHTGCKPYICSFAGCDWAFSSSSKLKRHQKKHTNDRKFVCEVASCGKAFMRSEHLKEHRLTHSERRYFQCHICNSRFSAKSSLYVHVKKHQSKADSNLKDSSNRIPSEKFHCSNLSLRTLGTEFQTEIMSREALSYSRDFVSKKYPQTVKDRSIRTFTKSYIPKANLRAHLSKIHQVSGVEGFPPKIDSSNPVPNADFIVCTPYRLSQAEEQMIMVAPCDAVIFSSPDPGVFTELDSIKITPVQQKKLEINNYSQKYQGSARTGLTCADVLKLKTTNRNSASAFGTINVGPGYTDFNEGPLLMEDFPSSMSLQDEIEDGATIG